MASLAKKMVTVGYYPYKRYSHDLRYQANAKYECFALFVQKMLQAVPTECAPYEKKNRNETKGGRFTADKALCCHSGTIYRKSSIKPPEG